MISKTWDSLEYIRWEDITPVLSTLLELPRIQKPDGTSNAYMVLEDYLIDYNHDWKTSSSAFDEELKETKYNLQNEIPIHYEHVSCLVFLLILNGHLKGIRDYLIIFYG